MCYKLTYSLVCFVWIKVISNSNNCKDISQQIRSIRGEAVVLDVFLHTHNHQWLQTPGHIPHNYSLRHPVG